ncbi:MAG TPA: hypothetical protein VHL50_04540 [Pyrinomonadaceae bacterium]|jgi:hypothetical protein|nr:hypothetical protein [Pyrinomonadaceae bacterium]
MNNGEQGSTGLGFLLVVGYSMVLGAYVLFVQKDSSLNWILLFLLAAAYPAVSLIERRVRHSADARQSHLSPAAAFSGKFSDKFTARNR